MIYCKFFDYKKNKFRELEVDCRLNVYPCCFILNNPDKYPFDHNLNTTTMKKISEEIESYFPTEKFHMCREKCDASNN